MDTTGFPIDLVLVRHGQSEGNLAQEYSKRGDDRLWTKRFQDRHTSQYRLTEVGRTEARAAGKWIAANIGTRFDRYYCSEFIRAMETAALLGLEGAEWNTEFYLREQDRGLFGNCSYLQRQQHFKDEMKFATTDSFYWCPAGGESLANACLRIDRFFDNILKNCSGMKVVVICHGNIMRGMRVRLERMSQHKYKEWQKSKDIKDKIHNGQVWHFSRRDPCTGKISRKIKWKRSVCPWDLSLSSNEWEKIDRPRFSNEDLLEIVSRVPQMIDVSFAHSMPELPPDMLGRAASTELVQSPKNVSTRIEANPHNHGTGEAETDEDESDEHGHSNHHFHHAATV